MDPVEAEGSIPRVVRVASCPSQHRPRLPLVLRPTQRKSPRPCTIAALTTGRSNPIYARVVEVPAEPLFIEGHQIADAAEIRRFAIEVDEAHNPPAELIKLLQPDVEVDPVSLYRSLVEEGPAAAGDSGFAIAYLETLKRRLREAFGERVSG